VTHRLAQSDMGLAVQKMLGRVKKDKVLCANLIENFQNLEQFNVASACSGSEIQESDT